jgi:hypothetical protein
MNIKHKTIDRVRITGPQADNAKAYAYLQRHDYHIRRSGPKMIGPGRCDPSRFAITAERELPNSAGEVRRNAVTSTGLLGGPNGGSK